MKSSVSSFWLNVKKTETCWLWQKSLANGYGQFQVNKKPWLTHRLSWVLHFGDIPNGLWVLHRCDVRNCVNPKHLFLGTSRDNVLDAMKKNRHSLPPQGFGEKSSHHKLTISMVRQIRHLLADGVHQRKIAVRYGVCQGTVAHISTGRNWRHN